VKPRLISTAIKFITLRVFTYLQIEEYKKAEEEAKHNHRNIWMYGDVRPEDDDKEFGL